MKAATDATAASDHSGPIIARPSPYSELETVTSGPKFSRWKICGIHVEGRKSLGFFTQASTKGLVVFCWIAARDGPGRRLVGNQSTLWQA